MKAILIYFLKLGATGFGGPIALIGLMEKHFVHEQNKISDLEFKRFVAAAKLFPGPTSTLIAIRIGRYFQGWKGGLLAFIGLIAPAFFMVIGLSITYLNSRTNPTAGLSTVFKGLNVGGLVLSVMAAVKFSKPLIASDTFFYFLMSGVLTFFYPQQEIFFLLSCGTLAWLHARYRHLILEASIALTLPLFFESFKASIFTFGSGIAIVPVLKAAYLDHHQWIDQDTFLTALSVGQMTPGPLVIMNSFLGHQVGGFQGALASTFGTFLPTLVFGIWLMPLFERKLLEAEGLKSFFHGMLPAVGGAILGSVARLCILTFIPNESHPDWLIISIFFGLFILGWVRNLHSILILILSALLAILASLLA